MISPYPVYPMTAGGKIRNVRLAKAFSELGLDVTLLTPFHFTQKRSYYEHEAFTLKQVKYPFLLHHLLTDRPFPYGYLTSFHPGLASMLRKLFHDHDIYQFEHIQFAALMNLVPSDKKVIYDAHNIEYYYNRAECKTGWVREIVGQKVFQLEKTLMERADHTFAVSAENQKKLSEMYNIDIEKISVAPNGMRELPAIHANSDKMFQRFPGLRNFNKRAIYSGSDVEHNRATVAYILDHLAPNLSEQFAFIIHGTCGRSFAKHSLDNVFFDFSEENFGDYAIPGTIGLNPVMKGSGTNLKMLHYLGHGLPVISTPFGMRGYKELKNYIIVCEPEVFAEALLNSEFPRQPDREKLYGKYSWKTIAATMKTVYEELYDDRLKAVI